jgi:hypothetical protein
MQKTLAVWHKASAQEVKPPPLVQSDPIRPPTLRAPALALAHPVEPSAWLMGQKFPGA